MNQYPLLKSAKQVMKRVQKWFKINRDKLQLFGEFNTSEVRLGLISPGGTIHLDTDGGCTLSVRSNNLIVACVASCSKIEDKIIQFLQNKQDIGKGCPLDRVEPFKPKTVQHAHTVGRPVSEIAKTKQRERREKLNDNKSSQKFCSVLEATLAAAEQAGRWLVLTERAKSSAAESLYNDPDYVYAALLDLAHTAKHNADHRGLGMPWADFLGQLGSHDFVPNTSTLTIDKFHSDYHITYHGEQLCIEAHLRQGTGLANNCLRIYVVQPRKPGDPIIIGHIGSHLPTADRSH
jgi:hypothetical protein